MQMRMRMLVRKPAVLGPPRFQHKFANGTWVVFDRHKCTHVATAGTEHEAQGLARDANDGKITFKGMT